MVSRAGGLLRDAAVRGDRAAPRAIFWSLGLEASVPCDPALRLLQFPEQQPYPGFCGVCNQIVGSLINAERGKPTEVGETEPRAVLIRGADDGNCEAGGHKAARPLDRGGSVVAGGAGVRLK